MSNMNLKSTKPFEKVAPELRLISYCSRDLAETARLILAYAGISYENITLQNFQELKIDISSFNFDELPILDWNGATYVGGEDITKLLGSKFGLSGSGSLEETKVTEIFQKILTFTQIIISYIKDVFECSPSEAEESYIKNFEPSCRKFLTYFDSVVSQSNSEYFLASGISYIDFAIANVIELLKFIHPEVINSYQNIIKIFEKVFALPSLQYYLSKRSSIFEIQYGLSTMGNSFITEKKWFFPEQDKLVIRHG